MYTGNKISNQADILAVILFDKFSTLPPPPKNTHIYVHNTTTTPKNNQKKTETRESAVSVHHSSG